MSVDVTLDTLADTKNAGNLGVHSLITNRKSRNSSNSQNSTVQQNWTRPGQRSSFDSDGSDSEIASRLRGLDREIQQQIGPISQNRGNAPFGPYSRNADYANSASFYRDSIRRACESMAAERPSWQGSGRQTGGGCSAGSSFRGSACAERGPRYRAVGVPLASGSVSRSGRFEYGRRGSGGGGSRVAAVSAHQIRTREEEECFEILV